MRFAQAIDAAIVIAVVYKSLAAGAAALAVETTVVVAALAALRVSVSRQSALGKNMVFLEGTKRKVLRLRANDLVFGANDSQPKA